MSPFVQSISRFFKAVSIVAGLAVATFLVSTSPAGAMSAPIHITSTVNIRPGPSTESGGPVGAIPTGASPDFQCWVQSQNINGVDVWFRIDYNGTTGYYASYWDDSSYSTDWQIVPKYGIPNCASAPAPVPASEAQPVPAPEPQPAPSPTPEPQPGPSPSPFPGAGAVASGPSTAEAAAIAWGRPFAASHSGAYHYLCLSFVFRAYTVAGINLRPWVRVPIGSNTYPQDIWGHFSHGQTGTGTPPAGALVFFRASNGDRTNSHVVLSTGGGNLISTADRVANYIHYETMSQHRYAIYQGWWLPDR
jgi:uncharacterized protein YraI